MREILFRGKRVDNGEWVNGYYVCDPQTPNEHIICYLNTHTCGSSLIPYDIIPSTIGQYTGLTDKNGNRIFEGDIVIMPAYQGGKKKAIVYFKNGKFAVDGSNYSFKDIAPKRMEIIGNIHDTPNC